MVTVVKPLCIIYGTNRDHGAVVHQHRHCRIIKIISGPGLHDRGRPCNLKILDESSAKIPSSNMRGRIAPHILQSSRCSGRVGSAGYPCSARKQGEIPPHDPRISSPVQQVQHLSCGRARPQTEETRHNRPT